MEFEGRRQSIQVRDVNCGKCRNKNLSSKHRRCKSESEKTGREDKLCSTPKLISSKQDMEGTKDYIDIKKMSLADVEVQNSLKQEILQLEKRLLGQFKTRCALEKALGCSSSAVFSPNDSSMPKPTKELIREIALLELEVIHLEQYLLSLYRKAFSHQIHTLSAITGNNLTMPLNTHSEVLQGSSTLEISPVKRDAEFLPGHLKLTQKQTNKSVRQDCEINFQEKLAAPDVQRSHSSLSHQASCSERISLSEECLDRAFRSFHSQPLSFLKEGKNQVARVISLAEHLGANIDDHVPETPNKLSEELVRCMCAIYCKLADPPLVCHGPPSSPISSPSSISALSSKFSPKYTRESILDSWLRNPFQVGGLKEFSGPYSSMVEVPLISRDPWRLRDVEDILQNYKSILHRLQTVDPREMNHEEKLAFWINIHNALMMHAYVEYGIPQNNVKKASLLIKESCIIGGRCVNAAIIQGSILCCRSHYPGQWLQSLLYPRSKNKVGDRWLGYTIEQQEPLLHFALCSGNHSDPAVRVYTPKRLSHELEAAKEEFIKATVRICKEEKIHIPKVVELYAKEMKLNSQDLIDMAHHHLSQTLEMTMQRFPQAESSKIIEWEPFNFKFRYLLTRELAL
ncbi:hypothetical protein Cni_G17721 [Canna indica]|uniref:Ternary complex factor MIP1, leucine-zipper n=1 Tax=Canna indica TaxID=4628 RepID=A0AAQ3QH19_9LILI|nr:hypothetical protein Cni_G17721 [Canna indica]